MPANPSEIDAWVDAVPRARVVPAVFLFDDSPFAKAAAQCLERLCGPDVRKVVLCGAASEGARVSAQLYAPGFPQSIAPLTLMADVAGWCVWFLGDETTDAATLRKQMAAVDARRAQSFHHILFLESSQPDGARARAWVADARIPGAAQTGAGTEPGDAGPPSSYWPFLLSERGALERGPEDLARAAVAYAYTGWRTYWERGDADLAAALSLPAERGALTLGMGVSEIDAAYHAQRWSVKVFEALRARLLKTGRTQRPVLKGIRDALSFLLPDWYLATGQEADLRSVEVVAGDDSAALRYLDRRTRRFSASLSHRRHFQDLLIRLKDKLCFLTFVALANARRFLQRRARELRDELWSPMRDCLRLPDVPDGAIQVLAERTRCCADHADDMREARTAGNPPTGSFHQDYERTRVGISAIPNLPGAVLRLALVAIGLAGLILAPLWWGGVRQPLADDALRPVVFGSGGVLIVCCLGVFIHYYYACLVAAHNLERTEANIEVRHLREIGSAALASVQGEACVLQKWLDSFRESLEVLGEALGKAAPAPGNAPRKPTGTWLEDEAVDARLKPRTETLAEAAYARMAAEFAGQPDEHGIVRLDPARWQDAMARHAAAVSREAVEGLKFDDCVRAKERTTGDKETLVDNLVRESRQPAWDARSDADAPVLCFSDPDLWSAYRGRHDKVAFYNLKLKDMVMVSVIPLREFTGP